MHVTRSHLNCSVHSPLFTSSKINRFNLVLVDLERDFTFGLKSLPTCLAEPVCLSSSLSFVEQCCVIRQFLMDSVLKLKMTRINDIAV